MLAFRLQLRLSGSARPSRSPRLSQIIRHSCFSTMADIDATSLAAEIERQKVLFNDLRINPATPVTALEQAKKQLGDLQRALGVLKKKEGANEKKDGAEQEAKDPAKKKERLLLKTAKGTRDYSPAEMFCRMHLENIVKDCFTTYGGSCLDTPVFERKDILTDKYGEDAKLIFDLQDQGGEQLALRYDHTVPLARYLAMMGGTNTQAKLWQVGKVYRRDNPVMSKGRMREFSQADFDISGVWDPMIPDAELLSLLCSVLSKLDVGEFTVKINHRKILDGIFEVCGVPQDKIRAISSAVDKLDKLPWSDVKKEMTDEKGLDPSVADKIGEYVKYKGGPSLLDKLTADTTLMSNPNAKQGLTDMGLLFTLLKAYQVLDKFSFDLSLARGLDYYTGIIYEAVVEASAPPGFKAGESFASSQTEDAVPAPSKKKAKTGAEEEEIDETQVGVGSIAAGGRYDNLVGAFLAGAANNAKEAKKIVGIPCVGVSIGMDRIFALVWPKWIERGMRSKGTMVYVMSAGDGLLEERVGLVRELREAGIKTDFLAKTKPKLPTQFAAGEKDEVPFAIILGTDELKQGLVTVKEQRWELVDGKKVKIESANKGTQVRRDELVRWLRETATWKEWTEIGL